jgi:glycosyltransferase involved in cell wall biosynthesis
MKILFVCRLLPYPEALNSGSQFYYHYISELIQLGHEVSVIAFAPPGYETAVPQMEAICRHVVPIPYHPTALSGRLWRLWWRFWLPRVYGRNVSVRFWRRLRRMVKEHDFDVVIVEAMMALYGPQVKPAAWVLDELDILSTMAYHDYVNQPGPIRRWQAKLDWLRTWLFELHYARAAAAVMVRAQKDKTILQDLLGQKPVMVVPFWGQDLEAYQALPVERPPGNDILLVGVMASQKNITAALFMAHEVMPLICERLPDARLYVVGHSPTPAVQWVDELPYVTVTGAVDSLLPYYEQCAVNVVPLFTGGSIIIKTLNGMAAARPTISTPFGAVGLTAKEGDALIVCEPEPALFAGAIVNVLTNEEVWAKLAHNGRAYIQTYHARPDSNQLVDFLTQIEP